MTSIRAEVKFNSRLTDIERRFAIPLIEIAQQLVPLMGRRISTGVASVGHFRGMGVSSPPSPGHGLFWIPPGSPQPSGHIAMNNGWAGYESYRAYLSLRGILGQPRNFTETSQAWNSLAVRVNGPGRVKVAFYGKHKYIAPPPTKNGGPPQWARRKGDRTDRAGRRYGNSEIMFLASRDEPFPMLTPSRAEIVRVVQMFQTAVGAQMIGEAADVQSIRKLGQRATKLQKRLSAQTLGRR